MGRWEPNARERLVRIAVDLFAEQGYDATTVNQIAERAGLTKTTFFRHFPDKREVLFAGQDIHRRILADAIAGAPDAATPLQAVTVALDALCASFPVERRELGARVQAIVAGNGELRERAASKRIALAAAVTDGLHLRGVPEPTASLAAELGVRAFGLAFDQWTEPAAPAEPAEPADSAEPAGRPTLTDLTRHALDGLRTAAAALE